MEYNVKVRKSLYNKFTKERGKGVLNLQKTSFLGKGYQGVVYSYCAKNLCAAVKKTYLENRQARFLKNPYSINALKYENFIELAAMKLINQLILQKVCPHFVLNYRSSVKKRIGACDDLYPYSSSSYNEFIDGSETFTKWVKKTHTIHEWYNAYFQITIAIFSLQHYFNMTHLDLHSDNILVKRIQMGGYWKYKLNGKTYSVKNYGYIFYLNDFGHAWIPQYFQSWIVRQKYKGKRINRNFDIMKLFNSTLKFSTSPTIFKNQIRKIIKDLEGNNDFIDIISKVWINYQKRITDEKLVETYNLDKDLNPTDIPKELQHLVLRNV